VPSNSILRSCRKAIELFEDGEEQMMEFVIEHDLGVTRAVILGRQGKYGEAFRQYLDEDQDLEALDLALAHIDDVIRDVDAFDSLVGRFFWRYLSFGCRGWPEDAKIPSDKILVLHGKIRRPNMNDRYQNTVCESPSSYLTGELADPWHSSSFSNLFCTT
jgi:hypothetical protein